MDETFWLGIVLGIVGGQAMSFVVRPMQRFLDRRVNDRTTVRSEELSRLLGKDRAVLRDWHTRQVPETTFAGAP
jgi:hypothetical protein